MSTIIKFDIKDLRNLAGDTNSCVIEKKVTQNLALQPWCLGNINESIRNLLDYKIGKFDKEFNGILLSYKNLHLLQNVGTIRNDNSDIHFQVQADYFIFKPYVGATLKGIVNKKSTTHLGILVHRVFNVVIPRPTEKPGNDWIGSSIQEGQEVTFTIVVLDLYGALPYIRGKLDESTIQFAHDGDCEEMVTASLQLPQVSYIDFDKTKPYVKKQSSDSISKRLKNNAKLNSSKHQLKHTITADTEFTNGNSDPKTNCAGKASTSEKTKPKRRSKVPDTEVKPSDPNLRPNKKHKRET